MRTWNGLNVDDRDWSALSEGERIRQIELEGYLIVPDILSPSTWRRCAPRPTRCPRKAGTTANGSAAAAGCTCAAPSWPSW